MTHRQALEVIAAHRGGRVVLSTMTAIGLWPALSDTPLDFAYMPSAMGEGPALALGLALAQPGRGVIVLNGEGSMLMNLGSLVTLAQHAADVCVVVLDNGLYEVTGGQPTPGARRVDFAGLARAAGIRRTYAFDTLEAWRAGAAEALGGTGPAIVWLKVEGQLGQKTPKPPRPMAEQIARLRGAMGTADAPGPAR
jgi:thiamine pyrophosphate-dependent acetolactate synthase large subunit-like protein